MKQLHVNQHVCASIMAIATAISMNFVRTQDRDLSRDRGAANPRIN